MINESIVKLSTRHQKCASPVGLAGRAASIGKYGSGVAPTGVLIECVPHTVQNFWSLSSCVPQFAQYGTSNLSNVSLPRVAPHYKEAAATMSISVVCANAELR